MMKLKHDELLPNLAFNLDLRREIKGTVLDPAAAASVLLSYCTLRAKARDQVGQDGICFFFAQIPYAEFLNSA